MVVPTFAVCFCFLFVFCVLFILFFVFLQKPWKSFCCLRLLCFYLLHGFAVTKPYAIDGAGQCMVARGNRYASKVLLGMLFV